jgi:hypothetical protein
MQRRRLRRACAAAALLGGLGIAGCMGSDSDSDGEEQRPELNPTAVRLVDCADWRSADTSAREDMIAALREFAGGPVGSPAGRGATLDDADAERLFDSYCAQDFATDFKLYKLYTRAASFGAR